jgi:pimeloyl-ACP methyl ester carboxylesterase
MRIQHATAFSTLGFHSWSAVIEGVGHLLQLQRPEPVARGVAAFLNRHPMPDSQALPARRSASAQ